MTKEDIVNKLAIKYTGSIFPINSIVLEAMEEYANQQKAEVVKATLVYVAENLNVFKAHVAENAKIFTGGFYRLSDMDKDAILTMQEEVLKVIK